VGLTDSNGTLVETYQYDPDGNLTSSTGSVANPWRFAGGYFDSGTGLYKFGARYYDPTLGRWSQQDPLSGKLTDPNSLNRYLYVSDDPVSLTDPSGQISSDCFGAIARAFAEAIGIYAAGTWFNGLLWDFLGTVAGIIGADLLADSIIAVLLGAAVATFGLFIAAIILVAAVAAIVFVFHELEQSHICP
jgi:RHS repeat-associated protein